MMNNTQFLLSLVLILINYGLGFIPSSIDNILQQIQAVSTKTIDSYHDGQGHTKLNLFWSGGNDNKKKKKEREDAASQNSKQTSSKMGSTATTMENFKQSQELGKRTGYLIQELSSVTVEGVAAKGKVKVFIDGQQQPSGVEIDDEYFSNTGVEDFSEALLVAMQDANDKSMQLMQDRMQALYADLGLPPTK
mmetsp:Transcript_6425/g.7980  ORF Transcript_6425/g.7980 Transcript_6425/m.7980 type:complete len:192 (-) Transcript_6425:1089-1664(-)|eukprot:CAMPEP_0203644138 /NCGR_PEP_ID=MMETSP0088-20131115/9568_1 /ASSEMBLY_ACC=CAM_ASM_001087 /TAXON_ID=426623 /ORGANISM="Chaetoceros affinis, Strain CCMP159" /LENGTH=191 /DNA_ID=CAMNT_0050500541 /DNA_START=58 /DNA_END=633 /DNA_ORIENTATION=-